MMKVFRFEFSSKGEADFADLEKSLQRRILSKLEYFENTDDPLSFAKKLAGLESLYRFRVGDYRIIVKPEEKGVLTILLILKIKHRREVYRFE